jgi:WD40 repeat protein
MYCVSVNPQNCHMLLTGGQDKTVKIWDTRNLNAKLHKFDDH